MDFEQPIRAKIGQKGKTARKIAEEIIDKYELKILKQYVGRLPVSMEEKRQTLLLARELLAAPEDDEAFSGYRRRRAELIARPVERCLRRRNFIIPMGAVNFLCEDYRRELCAVCAAAAELIAEERHGDLCCLIAGEYIEKRKRRLGSKLIAVHLVIDGENVWLYDGGRREITEEYSAYLPPEDRARYSRSDLVLSAMVDIAPRSIYVYGGESNLRLLRRIQLMFSGVYPVEGKRAMF